MAGSQYLTAYILPVIADAASESGGMGQTFARWLAEDSALMLIISAAMTLLSLVVIAHMRRAKFSTFIAVGDKVKGKIVYACALVGIGGNFWITTVITSVFSKHRIEAYDAVSGGMDIRTSFAMLLAVAVLGPVLEEIIFRGIILDRLTIVMKPEIAIIIQGILFGLMHGNLVWISYATFMGMILGYIKVCTNSLKASVITHMAYNIGSPIGAIVMYSFMGIANPHIVLLLAGAVIMVYGLIAICKYQPENKIHP